MIRAGRQEGWLTSSVVSFSTWALFNGCALDGVRFEKLPGRGSAVVATRDLEGGHEGPVITVPRGLVLSRERVELHAKSDPYLRELLTALGDYARTARGAILIFLLQQATIANPHISEKCGLLNPFTEYIKYLPEEDLPTFWSDAERNLLVGTTLQPAVDAKLKGLAKEFDNIRSRTSEISWCAKYWWDEDCGYVTLDDWMQIDAMYRSRALEFPGIGDAMVPCVDMANHAGGEATAALYETDSRGDAVLVLRDGQRLPRSSEVTITYGDAKGACEMVFSYGFLENSMDSAKELFLDLPMAFDDPLAAAKRYSSTVPPGVKLYEAPDAQFGRCCWHSDYVWLLCVNEEDGLEFVAARKIDRSLDLQLLWNGVEVTDTADLSTHLEKHPLWDVFQLRAVTVIQERVASQLEALTSSSLDTGSSAIKEADSRSRMAVRIGPEALAAKLRELEGVLLREAYRCLDGQKLKLVESPVVQEYLHQAAASEQIEPEEDFT